MFICYPSVTLSYTETYAAQFLKFTYNNFQENISIFFSGLNETLLMHREMSSLPILVYYSTVELLAWLCVKITACHTKPLLLLFSVVLSIICHCHSHCLLAVKFSQSVKFLGGMVT